MAYDRGSDPGCGAFTTGVLVGERVRKGGKVVMALERRGKVRAEDRVLQGESFSI